MPDMLSRGLLRCLNWIVSFCIVAVLCLVGCYAAYALWDNARVYQDVDNVWSELAALRPDPEKPGGPTFEELLAINGDVRAWLTVDNTAIDYPVLQGDTNLSYINTDVYGSFALSGSIFLDSRNAGDFSDSFCLVYGHHMDNSKMFGDLDLFKDPAFFAQNRTGTLILPGQVYDLQIFACLLAPASDPMIFDPTRWGADRAELAEYLAANALACDNALVAELYNPDAPRVLAMSTCATEFTDARTVVLAFMRPTR